MANSILIANHFVKFILEIMVECYYVKPSIKQNIVVPNTTWGIEIYQFIELAKDIKRS